MYPNNTNFVKYCNNRLSNSLITGIPKIVSTKNSQRKAFKLVVFFTSIAGFLWQTYTFLEIYLDYPVVQHITIEDPEVFNAPAVTLCNLSRLKRQPFCRMLPGACSSRGFRGRAMACKYHKKFCPTVRPKNYDFRSPKYGIEEINNQSNEFLQAVGPQSQEELLEKCTIVRSEQSIMCNDSIMIQVSNDGLPYKCFTFLSLIDKPNIDPENFSLSDYYSFRLNLHPEEYMYHGDLVGVYISVHDSRRLKNPIAENRILESGYSYRVHVTMQHKQNLPPPYETNCVDYAAMWKKNGGRGPLSKSDCMQFCMMDAMLDQHGCLNKAIFYPNNLTLCPHKDHDHVSEELLTKCEFSCYEGCDVTEFSVTSEIIDNLKDKLCVKDDDHCRASYLNLEINFNRLRVTRLKSEPMFTSEELFSHIGGYMGMWIGISFITLFDLLEMLVDIIAYPVMKWRNRKTRITSYADDKRNV